VHPHLRLVPGTEAAPPTDAARPTPPIEALGPAPAPVDPAEDSPTVHSVAALAGAEPAEDAPTAHGGVLPVESAEDAPTAHGAQGAHSADVDHLPVLAPPSAGPADPAAADLLDPATAYLVAENRRLGRERDDARRSAARAAEEVRLAQGRAVAAEEAAAPALLERDVLQSQVGRLRAELAACEARAAALEAELGPLRAFAQAPWWVRLRGR
jgi:hypothetical protein